MNAAAGLAVAFSSPALAAPPCAPRDLVVENLGKVFGEVLTAAGVTSAGALVELHTNPGKGTWTLIFSKPNGQSCPLASGDGWQRREPVNKDPRA